MKSALPLAVLALLALAPTLVTGAQTPVRASDPAPPRSVAAAATGDGDGDGDGSILRLLDLLEPDALLGAQGALLAQALDRPAAVKPLVREDFAGRPDPANPQRRLLPDDWRSGVSLVAAGGALRHHHGLLGGLDPRDQATVAIVTRESAGLVRDLGLDARRAAIVQARVRGLGRATEEAGLFIEPLERFVQPTPPADRPNQKLRVARPARDEQEYAARLDAAAGEEWQNLSLYVAPMAGRQGVRVTFQAAEGGLLVDSVEVRQVEPWATEFMDARAPDDRSTVPWRRIVRRGDERADCLILAHGTHVELTLAVPALRPRLTMQLAPLYPARDQDSRLHVRVDGETVHTEEFAAAPSPTAPPAPFVLRRVTLDRFAGRRIRLELRAESAGVGGILVGAPALLGSAADGRPPNLVLIAIDSLRAERLGCYGSSASLTPHLDRLAADGARFAQATAASSWTLPCVASLLTGQLPSVHGATQPRRRVDPKRSPPLGRLLADAGYVTAAFTGGGFLDPAFGFADGFDHYSIGDPGKYARFGQSRPREQPMRPVLDWIAAHADRPFFLFLHTYVVHDLAPNDEFVERVGLPQKKWVMPWRGPDLRRQLAAGDRSALPDLEWLYAAAVAQADEYVVGELLDALRSAGLDGRTLVAAVANDGQQWLEPGGAPQGGDLPHELVHVPWILRGPGIPSGQIVAAPVSQIDVAPTLLTRLALPLPRGMQGVAALGPLAPDRAVRAELVDSATSGREASRVDLLQVGAWKLIRRQTAPDLGPTAQLFDTNVDPFERDDLGPRAPARLQELTDRLTRELAAAAAFGHALGAEEVHEIELSPELERRLRELGYLGGLKAPAEPPRAPPAADRARRP